METTDQAVSTVNKFFEALGKGDADTIISLFDDGVKITLVKPTDRLSDDLYGTYNGIEGVKKFLANFGNTFQPQAFSVQNVIGNNAVAFANGSFSHLVKSTGNIFFK